MHIRLYALLAVLFVCLRATAQEKPVNSLYTGEIDGKIPVTMFLQATLDPCNGEYRYQGIYTYHKQLNREKWLWLAIDYNDKNNTSW